MRIAAEQQASAERGVVKGDPLKYGSSPFCEMGRFRVRLLACPYASIVEASAKGLRLLHEHDKTSLLGVAWADSPP